MLSQAERELAQSIGFDESVLIAVKSVTNAELSRLKGINFETEENDIDLDGIFLELSESKISEALEELCQRLPSNGYIAFIVENYDDCGSHLPDAIAVLQTTDQLEAIKVRSTDAANYDMDTEDIIAKLREWQQKSEFEILRVGRDTITLRFKTLPASICQFAEDVYEFCPDVVDQGIGLVYNIHENPEIFATANQLCPQLSKTYDLAESEMEESLDSIGENLPPDQMEKLRQLMEMAKQMQVDGYEPTTDEGIKLLAYEIQRSKYLGLWWD